MDKKRRKIITSHHKKGKTWAFKPDYNGATKTASALWCWLAKSRYDWHGTVLFDAESTWTWSPLELWRSFRNVCAPFHSLSFSRCKIRSKYHRWRGRLLWPGVLFKNEETGEALERGINCHSWNKGALNFCIFFYCKRRRIRNVIGLLQNRLHQESRILDAVFWGCEEIYGGYYHWEFIGMIPLYG